MLQTSFLRTFFLPFHGLVEELQLSLIIAAKEQSGANRKNFDTWLKMQFERRRRKEEIEKEKGVSGALKASGRHWASGGHWGIH